MLAVASAAVLGLAGQAFAAYGLPEKAPQPEAAPAPMAHTNNNWYIGGFGGVGFTPNVTNGIVTNRYKTGWDAGAKVGYRMSPMRYELEFIYQQADLRSLRIAALRLPAFGNLRVASGMANALYDFNSAGLSLVPYVGVGIGYANVRQRTGVAGIAASASDDTFAFQAMTGVNYSVMENVDLGVGYRYYVTSRARNALGKSYQNHMVNAEVIWHVA